MKIAFGQLKPVLGDKEANIEKIRGVAKKTDAELIVFAELFLSGYMVQDRYREIAETIDGPSIGKIKDIARDNDAHIVFGMVEKGEKEGEIFNSSVLVYPDGKIGVYRKIYLAHFGPFKEKNYFATGSELPVFDTRFGKLGMLICFDTFFPEVCKIMALKGADILVDISASPERTRRFFEAVVPTRAIENTVYMAYANLVGKELDMDFWGGDFVVGPRGKNLVKGEYFKEQLVECDIDMDFLGAAREARPTLKDTKLDIMNMLKEKELTF